ncbi:phosphodiesterase [Oscillibacter sp.]|uniref:phosphodiesterase n=1 Tax=Oscillibacter sp. TaxID=1945593 RepID=UPI00261A4212|nr:phosphodiesterase [Oscillibacter sp.]MDD3347814.1 phosphodiesterase [Oscillibacter sp.]
MKLLIASDLHGSAPCCRRLLDAFRREQADRLVLLGDLLYHGPRNPLPEGYDPPAVIALLNDAAEHLICVRGNCDADVDQMVLHFPILAESCFLAVDALTLFATHGHACGPDNPPPLRKGDYLVCGHTHLPVRQDCGTFTYLNPGSLSLPKEGTPQSYLTMENGVFLWHRLSSGETFQPLSLNSAGKLKD